ncbi:MAG: beta-N-acetylhexosaminidase [Gammaproteobacteria bacterium]|nr:MAG: beta-N-acetylhexosaminidase [Gammaproteobacteria bacterium]
MLMFDINGPQLSEEEVDLLRHPFVAGVILFAKNIIDAEQVTALTREIKRLRPELLIAVDQEGGRVQRLRQGYTRIPAMRSIAALAEAQAVSPEALSADVGYLLASEVLASGVDFSFAPVLDIDHGVSQVIGDRAFGGSTDEVIRLARPFIQGLHEAGAAAVGKHFPGHGAVPEDSHLAIPIDRRDWHFWRQEAEPFFALSEILDAIMPAHIVIEACDQVPIGFSRFWIQNILRQEMRFDRAIVSDDLCMQGAHVVGDMPYRVKSALHAGCDLMLICHDRSAVIEVLDNIGRQTVFMRANSHRLQCLRARRSMTWEMLQTDRRYQATRALLRSCEQN